MDSSISQGIIGLAVGKLGGLIDTYINEQYQYQSTDVRKNLKKLKTSFTQIKALIVVAERMGTKEGNLVEWLSELRNAIYDAEYVMDEFEYQRLKDIVESWPENKAKEVRTNKKVCLPLKMPSCCPKLQASASTFVKRLFFADEQLNDLLEIVNRFDDLVTRMSNFADLLKLHHEIDHRPMMQSTVGAASRETTSVSDEPSKLSGRDKEESKLLELLLQTANGSEPANFSVVSVVGVGGVGKTALAQSVFNHQRVKDYFQVRAWVLVSSNFDIKNLMKGIAEAAGVEKSIEFDTLERIQSVLIERLQSKRFLIVLDDVWQDMQHKWVDICRPFNRGMRGSKILITSRSREVAKTMGGELEQMQIDLSPLQFEYFWQFFQKCAFCNKKPEDYPALKIIGEGIARKLGGLPLAAKTMGGVLCTNMNIDHWRNVLNNKLWKEKGEVISALKLSYDHLPTHLKKCFAYCCLFPKDYKYFGKTLMNIWIALDCVAPTDRNKRLVDIQRSYIEELVSRCFLDVWGQYGSDKEYKFYVIHDLLHDLAERIVGNEVHRFEDDKSVCEEVPHTVRHLYVESTYSGLDLILEKISPKQLRSLIYVGVKDLNVKEEEEDKKWKMSEETIQKLRGLHLLFLISSFSKIKMWENIGDLLHLRCIYFHNRYIGVSSSSFPASFWKLYQLEMLHYPFFRKFRNFHLHKLINLRHVDHPDLSSSDGEIITSYLGRLKSLEVVPSKHFIVNGEAGNDIGQLGESNKIGGELNLQVFVELSEAEARKANLIRKQHLTELSIVDKCSDENEAGGIQGKAVEALQPHQNLQILAIEECRSITMAPTWLPTLFNLTKLRLFNLSKLQGFPPNLGSLLFLKSVWLQSLPSVKQIDVNIDDDQVLFPSLVDIRMLDMINFEGWSLHNFYNQQTTKICPKLSIIVIWNCPKLLTKKDCVPNSIIFPIPSAKWNISQLFVFPDSSAFGTSALFIDDKSLLPVADDYNTN